MGRRPGARRFRWTRCEFSSGAHPVLERRETQSWGHPLLIVGGTLGVGEERDRQFALLKTGSMIEAFIREAPERVENVMDLGIFKGGSVSFLREMFRPRRLVGLDLYKWPAAGPRESRISRQELSDAVRLDYEIDQGRPPRVGADHGGYLSGGGARSGDR